MSAPGEMPEGGVPEEEIEREAPRREASATFAVTAPEASEAAIRSAMDRTVWPERRRISISMRSRSTSRVVPAIGVTIAAS